MYTTHITASALKSIVYISIYNCICIYIYIYIYIHSPVYSKPSCLQATAASSTPHRSSQTVPHTPSTHTSTRPSV